MSAKRELAAPHARQPISLDQTISAEGNSALGDFIEDSQAVVALDAVAFTQLQDHLRSVLATLCRSAGPCRAGGDRAGHSDGGI